MKHKFKIYILLACLIVISLMLSYYMGRADESLYYASIVFEWIAGLAMAAFFVLLCVPSIKK
jgi:hypothetical protein